VVFENLRLFAFEDVNPKAPCPYIAIIPEHITCISSGGRELSWPPG
jgi:hypothetical protein